jgi:translation initiation factor 3 subunit I
MRPLILKGHTTPIKDLLFNYDNDLLFSASTDRYVTLWSSEYGERIGTYLHNAAVYTMSITDDSKYLVTGDSTGGIYIWEASTGTLLKKIEIECSNSIRSIKFNSDNNLFSFSFGGRKQDSDTGLYIYNINDVLKCSDTNNLKPVIKIKSPDFDKLTKITWINNDTNIIATSEKGNIYNFDVKDGKVLLKKNIHSQMIMDLDISKGEEFLLTASKDGKSLVLDPDTFDIMETLYPDNPTRNINACRFSPFVACEDEDKAKYHAFIAGGQESRDVTTTHAKKGGFECLIYNIIDGTELGAILGHFGPINALAITNDGELLASGAEESSVRVHRINNDEYNSLRSK